MKRLTEMTPAEFREKLNRKARGIFVKHTRHTKGYAYWYPAAWHAKFHQGTEDDSDLYLAARPNPGAGIGHQMANWIAGYWFAQVFHLNFAHIPFSDPKWESFLGFYQNEKTLTELKQQGYKVVRLPMFDEKNDKEMDEIRKIIHSYGGRKIVFLCEQDEFYHDQFGVCRQLQQKFYSAPARKTDHLIYSSGICSIAVHVRRGDIVQKEGQDNPELSKRFQSMDYFVNALKTALESVCEPYEIYLFSQGEKEDFRAFEQFDHVHYCLDMDAQSSFLHMVYADVLITSRSSFSYKPALLNKGVKYSPKQFWHGYPADPDWHLLDEKGNLIR